LSKIYRSHDLGDRRVDDVDLRARPMAPASGRRPPGGFVGYRPGATPPVVTSDIERRERETLALIEERQRQAETIQRDAYHAGFEQGERAGERLAAQKLEPLLKAFQELLESIARDRERLIEEQRQELIKIAFALATRVVHRAIEMEPSVVVEVVEAALAKAARSQRVTLRLSPHDRQLVEQQMKRRTGGTWPPASIAIQEDESVGRGGCRLETETGDIDATIEMQLRTLKTMLWEQQ
jgi:flagellar assembly protein FliH